MTDCGSCHAVHLLSTHALSLNLWQVPCFPHTRAGHKSTLLEYEHTVSTWKWGIIYKEDIVKKSSTKVQGYNEGGLLVQKKEDDEKGLKIGRAEVVYRWKKLKHESGYIQLHHPLVGLLPQHPIPFDILKGSLFNHFLILLYHGSFKLNHLNRDDWINLKQLCIDWYFPGQTAVIIWKFCNLWHQQLPPLQRLFVLSIPSQQIIWWLNWEEEQWQKIHLVQIEESEEESCVKDDST